MAASGSSKPDAQCYWASENSSTPEGTTVSVESEEPTVSEGDDDSGVRFLNNKPQAVLLPPGLKNNFEELAQWMLDRIVRLEMRVDRESKFNESWMNAHDEYLRGEDPSYDDKILGRTLLDQGMAHLALISRSVVAKNSSGRNTLLPDLSNASRLWRRYLKKDCPYSKHEILTTQQLQVENDRRLRQARSILRTCVRTSPDTTLPDGRTALENLLEDTHAMTLLTKRTSLIREAGDRRVTAHTLASFETVRQALCLENSSFLSPSDSAGMDSIITFLENVSAFESPKATSTQAPATAKLTTSIAGAKSMLPTGSHQTLRPTATTSSTS
ncbi:hypothetical protein BDN70DRAFT_990185 [Pholiota conissans]|uniref:Uncharacterized protein n=1 Tax=Pholiota conissans TaxID=109636 RepID=A0A9P5Z9Y9_9AGAR|nr:hypothetical protein BDN70DRAFT_990185 [Pholiota conissans]